MNEAAQRGGFLVYLYVGHLSQQEGLSVLDNDTAVGARHGSAQHVVHRCR